MKYYDVFEDLERYPEASIIFAYSRRGVGKTYGALFGALERGLKVAYMKRTNRDIDLLCKATKKFDTSPYKPINRDHPEYNIMPVHIDDGIGAFYQFNENNEPVGDIVAYALSLNNIKSIKGFDLSDVDLMIMDECIPQSTEIEKRQIGYALLDAHETISRDRIERGRGQLPLLLFSNAENVYCNIVDALELIDDLADVATRGLTYKYIEERGILIHHINEIPLDERQKNTGLYKAMYGTSWFRKSFEGMFNNDFSNVEPRVLKQYKPLARCLYREGDFYIYKKDRDYYLTKMPSNKYVQEFNLNRDNDVRYFYAKYCFPLQEACMTGHVKFSNYSIYDLIVNYDKRFANIL